MKFSIFLLSLFLVSCDFKNPSYSEVKRGDSVSITKGTDFDYGINFKVVEIDSCEYVIAEEWQKAISIIHKKNCRFCAKRVSDLLTNK